MSSHNLQHRFCCATSGMRFVNTSNVVSTSCKILWLALYHILSHISTHFVACNKQLCRAQWSFWLKYRVIRTLQAQRFATFTYTYTCSALGRIELHTCIGSEMKGEFVIWMKLRQLRQERKIGAGGDWGIASDGRQKQSVLTPWMKDVNCLSLQPKFPVFPGK